MFVVWVIKALVEAGYHPVFAVPRHRLGDEIVRLLAEHGITGRVYRGREVADPDAPSEQMCRDLDRVKEIENALGDPSAHACKHKDKECEFFRICGYQKQRREKPQVWLIPHQLLFRYKPSFIKCYTLG